MSSSVVQNPVDEIAAILSKSEGGFVSAPTLIEEINKELGQDDRIQFPDTWRILRNEYAILLLCPFQQGDTLTQKAEDILETFHHILIVFENKKGHLLDGYALLVMDEEPEDKETLEDVSEIQINRHVCRMQVLWPDMKKESPWSKRLQYLPVYPLPRVSLAQDTKLSSPYGSYALHVKNLLGEMAISKVSEAIKEKPYVNQ